MNKLQCFYPSTPIVIASQLCMHIVHTKTHLSKYSQVFRFALHKLAESLAMRLIQNINMNKDIERPT